MSKKGYFTQVDNGFLRSGAIKPHELAVYLNLQSRQGNNESAWPSHATIARETSMSESKVKTCIKWLAENALLSKRHRYQSPGRWTSNAYFVTRDFESYLKTHPQSPDVYKEDSSQEYSSTNSSISLNKRSWRFLDPRQPATTKQLDYLSDLISKFGEPKDLFNGDGEITWEGMTQTEADTWIEMYFVHQKRTEHFN